ERVGGRAAVELEDHASQGSAASTPPRMVGEQAILPPRRAAREHARRLTRHTLINRRNQWFGLLERYQPRSSPCIDCRKGAGVLARHVDLGRHRADTVT